MFVSFLLWVATPLIVENDDTKAVVEYELQRADAARISEDFMFELLLIALYGSRDRAAMAMVAGHHCGRRRISEVAEVFELGVHVASIVQHAER